MTGTERQHLRQLIDQHRREHVNRDDAQYGVRRCAGCAGELDNHTIGCAHCKDRRQRRANRKRVAA